MIKVKWPAKNQTINYTFVVIFASAVVAVFLSMAYKDKLERLFRIWHVISRRKARRAKKDKD